MNQLKLRSILERGSLSLIKGNLNLTCLSANSKFLRGTKAIVKVMEAIASAALVLVPI